MKTPQPLRSAVFLGVALLALAGLLALVCIPNFVGGGPSKTSRITNNLRQLAGAKEQWALEHSKTGAVAVTREDIAFYFGRGGIDAYIVPVANERYTLGNLNQSPEALLTRPLEGRPKGTIIRLGTNSAVEIILPNHSMQRMRASRLCQVQIERPRRLARTADAARSLTSTV